MSAPAGDEASATERADPAPLARLARAAALAAGVALVGVAAVQAWQVFARYVMNDSPGWTEPLALLLLNTAMSLGAAASVYSGTHFGFFVAIAAAPPRAARTLRLLADLVMAATGAVIAYFGVMLLVDGWAVPMAGIGLPQGMPFLPLALGGALMSVFALARAFARPATQAERAR